MLLACPSLMPFINSSHSVLTVCRHGEGTYLAVLVEVKSEKPCNRRIVCAGPYPYWLRACTIIPATDLKRPQGLGGAAWSEPISTEHSHQHDQPTKIRKSACSGTFCRAD